MTIKLADGTLLNNIELNGNNYISKVPVDESLLTNLNLRRVEIIGETTEVLENATLCNFWEQADGTHMIFRLLSEPELKQEELNARIEYLAMMTDIEL